MALYNTASPSGREKSMIRLLKAELTGMGITHYQDRKGNLYAVKGRARTYPCVVAHMDEVHRRSGGDYAAHMVDGHFVVGYDRKRKKMAERHLDMPEMPGRVQGHEMRVLRAGRNRMHRQRSGRHGLLRGLPVCAPVRPQGRQRPGHPDFRHGLMLGRVYRTYQSGKIRLSGSGWHAHGCICAEKKGAWYLLRQHLLRIL